MTFVFLAILAVAWIAVLLPAVLRAKQGAPLSSAERFKRGMQLIAPPPARNTGRWIVAPAASPRARARDAFERSQERRARLLARLGIAAGASGLFSLFLGGAMWQLHAAIDMCLALYVAFLLGAKRRREERVAKVRHLARRSRAVRGEVTFLEPVRATASRRA